MTPPHITDSDLVHMMDLVWTSHTDKQQPHRQHLSWKRNAVACFGCCFTADLTSTYMFRAIFDCYGNTCIYWFNDEIDDIDDVNDDEEDNDTVQDDWISDFT